MPKKGRLGASKKGSRQKIESQEKNGKVQDEDDFYHDLTDDEFQSILLSKSNLKRITYVLFRKKLQNPFLCSSIASVLQDKLNGFKKFTQSELEDSLPYCDKDLFTQFRDKDISFD